ncbi:hypothetical protein BCR42DRAFT_417515 [Absidia repens]|uniref:Long-chain-alcohol oxidase n=1 Tax=Absidia repens TaxID=90262 RepID=A0A1X2IE14_9FUNG|nr:hypothetical protein BCR42DRAFT_417515 [Absidia repens]
MLELTENQQRTLINILDTFVPQLSKVEAQALLRTYRDIHQRETFNSENLNTHLSASRQRQDEEKNEQQIRRLLQYAKFSTSNSIRSYKDDVFPFLNSLIPGHHGTLVKVIKMMGSSIGMCLLTKGKASTSFEEMTEHQRQALLLSWKSSKSTTHRFVYRLFCSTALFLTYRSNFASVLTSLGYCHPHLSHDHGLLSKKKAMASVIRYEEPLSPSLILPVTLATPDQVTDWMQNKVCFDTIIVGSGSAAGPCATQLAKAGKSVLVIEKGSYIHPIDMTQSPGYSHGYENGNYFFNNQCSTLGGGTRHSYGAYAKTPLYVLQDWKRRTNDGFDVVAFEEDLQAVYDHVGASSDSIIHTAPNRHIINGCNQLNLPVNMIPHSQLKNGGTNTNLWFHEAQAYGAKFLTETTVHQVLIRNGHAHGVECTISDGQHVSIYARTIIMAAGALHTPQVLQKSGLENKHIGQHLRVHPTVFVNGYFPENQNHCHGDGIPGLTASHHMKSPNCFGCRVEAPCIDPGLFAVTMNWHGGLHHKQSMLGYNHGCPLTVMGRDMNSTGSVISTTDGASTLVKFELSKHDQVILNDGVIRALNILVSAGARHLHTCHLEMSPFLFKTFEESSVNNHRYLKWLDGIRETGLSGADGLYSFHQMGSCRLGHSPKTSAVQLTGETWEIKNLYVADGSLMPSACGVNPIITIQTLALGVAKKVLQRLDSKTVL